MRTANRCIRLVTALGLLGLGACAGGGDNTARTSGEEGDPCNLSGQSAPLAPCKAKLKCVESVFTVGVCGRPCKTDTDCGHADEMCFSYSGQDKDGHCVNLVKDEYAQCGVGDTSVCDGRSCLYLPNRPVGVCIDTCALDGSLAPATDGADGGSDQDAGVDSTSGSGTAPQGAVACAQSEMCVDDVLASPLPNEGVCGMVAQRGDPCGIAKGIYCQGGDICAPKDPSDLSSELRCFQDCSSAGGSTSCDTGKCLDVQGLFAYCM